MSRAFHMLVPLLLLVSACCGYLHKYVRYTGANMTTWKKAQSFCRKHHTDLAIINNRRDNNLLQNYTGWIGLHRYNDTAPWKWSKGNKRTKYIKWATNEPSKGEHCSFKHAGENVWKSGRCDEIRSFLCSDESMVLIYQNLSWEEALDHCRALWRREAFSNDSHFDLSTLISQHDVEKAREMAVSAITEEVWTGLRFLAGRWWWLSGEPAEFDQTCPNVQSCGILDKSGHLKISDCTERKNFICRKLP